MTTPPIEKITKLIALSTSPSEHEARTSAFLACRLLREHAVVLLLPTDTRLKAPGGRAPPARSPWPPWTDAVNEAARRDRERSRAAPEAAWVELASRYAGWCRVCKRPYEVGDRVLWKRDDGCHHLACHGKAKGGRP